MNPNPEVWGAPDTWVNQNIMYTPNSYPAIKAGKAKVASFRNLNNGITQDKFDFGIDPIDNTICPVGQDPQVSCFGKLHVIGVNSIPSADVLNPEVTKEFETPVNWCFTENGAGTQGWTIRNYYTSMATGANNERWSPNSGTINTGSNRNTGVCPFVYYQLKTLLLSIKVQLIDGYSDGYYGYMPYSSGSPWVTLADWKNNYPTKKAFRVKFDINSVYNGDLNNITYQSTGSNMPNFCTVSVALLDGLELIKNDDTIFYDYATFQIEAKSQSFDLVNSFHGTNNANRRYIFLAVDKFENSVIRTTKGTSNDYVYCAWQEIPYTEKNYEAIMKMVACFGVPFTDTNKLSFKLDFTDTELCLPVIDENGVTHGEYTRGTANTSNDIYNADSVRDKNYDPSRPPTPVDPNTYSNITGFNTVTTNAALTKRYVLDAANVEKLADDLWTICSELSSTDFEHFEGKLKDEFLTQNPIDCIISLQRFPFQIPGLGTKAPIRLGKSEGSAQGYTTYFIFNTILFSGKQIFPRFGNCFLDYEPYTSYEIYVPFCGTRKLRAEDLIGHTVNVHMQIDLITGSCTAYIMADELVIETLNGSCAVDQQLSGAQTATMNANIFNGILAQKQTDKIEGMNIAKTWLPGNWVSDLMDPMGNAMRMSNAKYEAQKANYDITHVQVPPHKIGAASPLLGWYQEFDARIIIYYPEGDVIDSTIPPSLNASALATFGHLKGFGTVTPGTVSQFRGDVSTSWYLQGDIIADGIPCTDSERKRIKSMFAAGVYV